MLGARKRRQDASPTSNVHVLRRKPPEPRRDRIIERPSDWPGPGPIDLAVHDLPHGSSTTEWWYMNTHLTVGEGRKLSLFACFFRQVKGQDPVTKEPLYAHSTTWALSDVDRKKYTHVSRVDRSAPEEGLKRMKRGLGAKDPRLNRALAEMLERDALPSPDRMFEGRVFVNLDKLELEYAGDSFEKLDDGSYRVRLEDEKTGVSADLTFEPLKPPTRHGDDGVVRGSDNERMFYYFIPRCRVTGWVSQDGEKLEVTEGQGWYDHEFGVGHRDFDEYEGDALLTAEELERVHEERRTEKQENSVAWNWLSCQLDDGTDITAYPLVYLTTQESAGDHAIVIAPDGTRSSHDDMTFEPLESWQSSQTFFEYPTRWRLKIPSARVDVEVTASFDDQEFITLISKPSFWEGRVEVEGTIGTKPVQGPGYVERSGYTPFEDLDGYFKAVGKVVRKSVADVLPEKPTYEHARDLVASRHRDQYMDGLDLDQFARTLIKPIREITDRGGKGWRSYAAITCCDLVGGDSRKFVQWLAMPEMMHVGSLIVDDVQDKSTIRRGGPTAHVMYGEAQAINSGTAAYFVSQRLLSDSEHLSDAARLRIYDLYFEAMRAGHAGQAIDIDGFEHIMPAIVASGDGEDLERRVLAVHRLKTAAPAGCLARMGAVAGSGTDRQVEMLGQFFEALGLSFQIVDDVLNLRGFKGNLKQRGEDVTQGKVTLPVAKAMSRLPSADREWLWETLQSRPEDEETVGAVIDKLESSGAIEACSKQSRDLVENAWNDLAPCVDDTLAKLMLRAFSWYILERHY